MACSEKRLAANRLNSLRSTGPRTPEGKRRSSQNARKHGLRANGFDPAEYLDPEVFSRVFVEFWNERPPRTQEEFRLIAEIARCIAIARPLEDLQDGLLAQVFSARTNGHTLKKAGAISIRLDKEFERIANALILARSGQTDKPNRSELGKRSK